MSGPDFDGLLLRGVGFLVGALLLWLGLEIGATGRLRKARHDLGPAAVAGVLIAGGLWWPGHWIAGPARPPGATFVAAALALGCAAAWAVSSLALGRRAPRPRAKRRAWVGAARAFGAPAAALALALGADRSGAAAAPAWAEAALTAALALVGFVLLQTPGRALGKSQRTGAGSDTTASQVDALTQLPMRVHFERRLASAMRKCDADERRLALLFIDLDGFKPVNDTFGHSVGDAVLEQVGRRLNAMSRGRDIVARVGGDEFLLLLPRIGSDDSVASIATRLIEGLSQPYAVEDRDVAISCSIGIALYPGASSLPKLVARADAAMYAAKRSGGSTHCFYTPAMDVDAEYSFELMTDLRKALANNELELFYQPKIDAKSGKVTAAEALLRWNHPTRGEIGPALFIPIAERAGLIAALGNWVIEDACRQGRVWRDKGLRMRVAINLSPQQMRRDDIVAQIAGSLDRHRIHPSLLTCEITESLAMEDTKATQETFRRLGELGAHLSIDDFGTGYSSLSYLRRLPAEELKIDRSFITDLEHSADARAIVNAVVKLAHALGLKVVAEGVENQRQQQILVQLGCDELQGFLFAKPMSARALLLWAMNDRTTESPSFRTSLFGETMQVPRAKAPAIAEEPG